MNLMFISHGGRFSLSWRSSAHIFYLSPQAACTVWAGICGYSPHMQVLWDCALIYTTRHAALCDLHPTPRLQHVIKSCTLEKYFMNP